MNNNIEDLKNEMLTRRDVMKILNKSQVTIWTWVRRGILREHTLGKSVYYLKSELMEDIKRNNLPLTRNSRTKAASNA